MPPRTSAAIAAPTAPMSSISRAPNSFRSAFGEGSAAAHQAEATRCGLTVATMDLAGIGFNIDTPAELAVLSNGQHRS